MKYFTNCSTLEEVKKQYRTYVKQYAHVFTATEEQYESLKNDRLIVSEINTEYDFICAKLTNAGNFTAEEKEDKREENEAFKNIITKIAHLNVIVEVVGKWIWVSGTRYEMRNDLKNAGLFWANAKKMWFWHAPEDKCRNRTKMSIEEIKTKYGSKAVNTSFYRSKALA